MCRHSTETTAAQPEPSECPFTIRKIDSTTYLIRENDRFNEFPHIYVKMFSQTDEHGHRTSVLMINDTGVGTTVPCYASEPTTWNIRSFVDRHFNPDGEIPYLIALSHCHYDHILGLESLLGPQEVDHEGNVRVKEAKNGVAVMSSSYQRSFLTPYAVLEEHSLCKSIKIPAPVYETTVWAADNDFVVYKHPSGIDMKLPITTLHIPGHTPDSLSWYDIEERTLYVGDAFYEQESDDSRAAPWGQESPAPILFPNEANLYDWWRSVGKLMVFVTEKNLEEGKRVTIAAGHVTASVDAHDCLLRVRRFMANVLRDEAPFVEKPPKRGEPFGQWTDVAEPDVVIRFSLGSPIRIVEEGRQTIPEAEWQRVEG